VELTADRLVLRPFAPADADALHGYLSRPEAVRFEPYGVQSAQDCVRLAAERAQDDRFLAICRGDANGPLIGNLYLAPEGPPHWRAWTVGYVQHPDHWGHGYATEAVTRLIDHLIADRGAHRVLARCDPRNERSWRLLERVGMRREAHVIEGASFTVDADGAPVWHDTDQYAVLDREWRERRGEGRRAQA
jgi:RimJ/RimL family protein N-acetyltransferase